MRDNSIQQRYTTGRFTLPIVYITCTIGWIISAFYTPANQYPFASDNPIWNIVSLEGLPTWLSQAGTFGILSLVGYLLIQLNNQFTIITQRATVQSTLFLLFITAIPQLHIIQPSIIIGLCFVCSTFFLFLSYKEWYSMRYQFFAGAFMAVIFFMEPKTILLFPLYLLSRLTFNCLNLRTFCASVLGFSLPIWFLLAHAIWHEQMELFYYPFTDIFDGNDLFNYHALSWDQLATWGYMVFISILAMGYLVLSSTKMRTRTRQMINHFNRIAIYSVILTIIYPNIFREIIPIWLISISFTYGYALMSNRNKISNYLFLFSLGLLITLFCFNVWML